METLIVVGIVAVAGAIVASRFRSKAAEYGPHTHEFEPWQHPLGGHAWERCSMCGATQRTS